MIIEEFTKAEFFLERWSGFSDVVIAFATIVFSIVVPYLIYFHQRKEIAERLRQRIIAVIEETEIECRDVKKIAELCIQVHSISMSLKMSGEDKDCEEAIKLAKIKLSEFKKLSGLRDSKNRNRNYLGFFVENRNTKMTIIKPGKKIKIKTLEKSLLSIYSLIETNYKMRELILKKIPETEIIFQTDSSECGTIATILLSDIYNTFASVDDSIKELEQNSRKIVETWEQFCLSIYWKNKNGT